MFGIRGWPSWTLSVAAAAVIWGCAVDDRDVGVLEDLSEGAADASYAPEAAGGRGAAGNRDASGAGGRGGGGALEGGAALDADSAIDDAVVEGGAGGDAVAREVGLFDGPRDGPAGADARLTDSADGRATSADATADIRDVAALDVPLVDAASITLALYQHLISVAWCDRVAECCQSPGFDRARCVSSQDQGPGPENVSVYLYAYKQADAGFPAGLTFDAEQAARCINMQRTRDCLVEMSDERRTLYSTCVTALHGSMPMGGVCITSLECSGGLFCSRAADAGTGVCAPIGAAGAACGDPNLNGDRCSSLGVFGPGSLYCSNSLDSFSGMCKLGRGDGVGCSVDQECATPLICSSFSKSCALSQPYPALAVCALYSQSDAGPDARTDASSDAGIDASR